MIPTCHECGTPLAPAPPCPLTDRELQVVRQLALGHGYGAIAIQTGISRSAVRSRMQEACRRVGAVDRAQLVGLAALNGWLA